MRVISYSEASQSLLATMRQTTEDHAPVLIVNQSGASCVLMSLAEYKSLQETAYLMRSPANVYLVGPIQHLANTVSPDIAKPPFSGPQRTPYMEG